MSIEWKDATSWQRGEDRGEPRAWEVKSGPIKISIVSNHIYHPGEWVMHCHALGIDTHPLSASSADEARGKAIVMAQSRAFNLDQHVKRIKHEIKATGGEG